MADDSLWLISEEAEMGIMLGKYGLGFGGFADPFYGDIKVDMMAFLREVREEIGWYEPELYPEPPGAGGGSGLRLATEGDPDWIVMTREAKRGFTKIKRRVMSA